MSAKSSLSLLLDIRGAPVSRPVWNRKRSCGRFQFCRQKDSEHLQFFRNGKSSCISSGNHRRSLEFCFALAGARTTWRYRSGNVNKQEGNANKQTGNVNKQTICMTKDICSPNRCGR